MSIHASSAVFRAIALSLLCFTTAGAATGEASTSAELLSRFRSPSPETRPFVRWWWNGGRINETEIIRQLDVLHAAGMGGVEINTIAMPVASVETRLPDHPEIPWLSAEWCRLVRVAAEGARERAMTADLLVGSGWPLGGRFLAVEQQTQRVRVERQSVRGPVTLTLHEEDLLRRRPVQGEDDTDEVEPARTALVFVRLVRSDAREGGFDAGVEHLGEGDRGSFVIPVPAGDHEVHVGLREWGFTQVKLGAPGADGPVVDHFSAEAVRAYLDYMTAGLAPALGGRLGNHLRALFVDSIELDYANWTGDVPEEFQRRRGYDLHPYLPFVLEPETRAPTSAFERTVQQARYDFNRTLVELFQERFIGTFTAFCDEQGVLARVQAYGRETHPLHGSMLVHLPEGESWLWPDRSRTDGSLQRDSTAANKYVSSAAHLTGQSTVSFEAMTSAVAPFRETLADFKVTLDLSFLDGLNHPILHGFNYSPRDAGLPGWMRFGSFISDQNPWWPAFGLFNEYAARVGSALRGSLPRAEIAILPPQADEWGRFGRLYQPFPEIRHPWYLFDLPRAIQHSGNGTDFVSEEVIQEAVIRDGKLAYGPQAYSAVILAEVDSMAPATLEALIRFARTGGKILILGEAPAQVSGLHPDSSPEMDDAVETLSAQLKAVGHHVVQVSPPPPYLEDATDATPPSHRKIGRGAPLPLQSYAAMVPWARERLDALGIAPKVRIDPLSPFLSQVHHSTGDGDLYFFANRSSLEAVQTTLTFPHTQGVLWRWDPEAGERSRVQGDPQAGLALTLAPQTSVILVFDRGEAPTSDTPPIRLDADAGARETVQRIPGPWNVELLPPDATPSVRLQLEQLRDLSTLPETADFGGVVRYQTDFSVDDPSRITFIDLGAVHGVSELLLNGRAIGSRWYGPHTYAVVDTLQRGRNELVITIRTRLANFMRAKRGDPAAQRWAFWYDRIPTGLEGPVTLRAAPVQPHPAVPTKGH